MSRPLILLSAALLSAAPAAQAAPKAAKKTPAAAAGRQNAEETVRLPPVFREAETDKTGFPQTGRAIWRLHADANGKIVRREQKTNRAVANRQQLSAICRRNFRRANAAESGKAKAAQAKPSAAMCRLPWCRKCIL